jgi:hypothetical protein
MGKDRAIPHQPEAVIDIQIVARIRETAQNGGDLIDIFRNMSVHQGTGMRCQNIPATPSCASEEVSAKRGVTA